MRDTSKMYFPYIFHIVHDEKQWLSEIWMLLIIFNIYFIGIIFSDGIQNVCTSVINHSGDYWECDWWSSEE